MANYKKTAKYFTYVQYVRYTSINLLIKIETYFFGCLERT